MAKVEMSVVKALGFVRLGIKNGNTRAAVELLDDLLEKLPEREKSMWAAARRAGAEAALEAACGLLADDGPDFDAAAKVIAMMDVDAVLGGDDAPSR